MYAAALLGVEQRRVRPDQREGRIRELEIRLRPGLPLEDAADLPAADRRRIERGDPAADPDEVPECRVVLERGRAGREQDCRGHERALRPELTQALERRPE